MFRSVRTVSQFCINSNAPVPRLLLGRFSTAPKTAAFGYVSSSNLRCSSSDAKKKEESGGDKAKKKTPSAIDLGLKSVVKVFTVFSKPRLFQPWQISMQSECSGSGFIISGKKIITNAHVVANHTSVKVRKHGSSTRYKAKVRAMGHECDLAILEVDSDEFWEGMNFLELGDIPLMQDTVAVVGYPRGGDSISVTKGVVSRVTLIEYSHSSTELLAIQIDAAINSGNSGGPVIKGDKVAGVAFESLCLSDGIGYIIPTPVVKHFLNGVKQHDISFGSVNLSYQTMGNAQMRDYFKMSKQMTGILINEINPLSDAYKLLKKDDVILAMDGVPIGNDGRVRFRKEERVIFKHLVSLKKPCETALLKVLREGKEYEFNIGVKPVQPLVPMHDFDKIRSYYIYGGFLFILEDDTNAGYSILEDLQVKKVNGVEVDNLKHLCQVIEECCTGFLRLDLEDEKVLILNNKSARKANSKILKDLKVPSAMSEDLQPRKLNRGRVLPRHTKNKISSGP